jgi:hypothetical protein
MTHRDWEMPPALLLALADLAKQMEGAQCVMAISTGHIDGKLIAEIGAAVLLGKPMIVLAIGGDPIPPKLRLIADEIIEAENFMDASRKFNPAIERVLARLKREDDTAGRA